MIDAIFTSTIGDSLTLGSLLANLIGAAALGALIAGAYLFTHRKEGFGSNLLLTLVILPGIISMVIMFIGNNLARAFSLAGAFALIRFRSAPGDPKDIAYVFLSMAVGLGCGMGYLGYAAVFVLVMSVILILHSFLDLDSLQKENLSLKIQIPENLDYLGVFDEVLDRHTTGWKLRKVRSMDFGTLFELSYQVRLAGGAGQKALLDELRTLNGNLPVSLVLQESTDPFALS